MIIVPVPDDSSGHRIVDLRALLGVQAERIVLESEGLPKGAQPLKLTHLEALNSFDPMPKLTAGDHVLLDSGHLDRDVVFGGGGIDLARINVGVQQKAVAPLLAGAVSIHGLAAQRGVAVDEVQRWLKTVYASAGDDASPSAPSIGGKLEIFDDEDRSALTDTAFTDVHLWMRQRFFHDGPASFGGLPHGTKRLVIEAFLYPCVYMFAGGKPHYVFETIASLEQLEELTIVGFEGLNATALGRLGKAPALKKITLAGCARPAQIAMTKGATKKLEGIELCQLPRPDPLPADVDPQRIALATRRLRRAFLQNVLRRGGLGPGARLRQRDRQSIAEVIDVNSSQIVAPSETDSVKGIKVRFQDGTTGDLDLASSFVWGGAAAITLKGYSSWAEFDLVTRADFVPPDVDAWVAGEPFVQQVLDAYRKSSALGFRLRCLGC